MRKSRRVQKEKIIPFAISFALTFVEDDLSPEAYEAEVRRIVREKLPQIMQDRLNGESGELWEEEDPFVYDIIEEELARN